MQLRQAMADLAEVRGRLATVQRFDGYSSQAAIASGGVAILCGIVQYALVPHPAVAAQYRTYLLVWRARQRGHQADAQMRTVGMSILPAIAAGAVITMALVARGLFDLLPGMWCAAYALGLFSSRAMVPRDVVYVAVAFGAFATLLFLLPGIDPLSWWVMPLAFGGGQIAIGTL